MADKELDEIKKLPPKKRLRRLKELEERRKKEEQEARRLADESLKEIKLDEMLREIDVPEQDAVDVNRLFQQQSEDIEDQVRKQKIRIDEVAQADYAARIQQLLPQNTVQEIQQWYARDNVPPSRAEFLEVYEQARDAYNTLQQTMQKRPDQDLYSSPSQELVENVVSSMRLLRSMGYKHKWFEPGGGPG
ncbi:hypothetical protein KY363_02265 [Candidatus Woesearchaeota archaeon]|nr:hypothetical protein [Candidatus Woesearchaeota archaeon]